VTGIAESPAEELPAVNYSQIVGLSESLVIKMLRDILETVKVVLGNKLKQTVKLQLGNSRSLLIGLGFVKLETLAVQPSTVTEPVKDDVLLTLTEPTP
jgi:hypothetical protein